MTFRKGDIVCVEFDDHVEQDDKLAHIVAYGRVAKATARMVLIETWHPKTGVGNRDQNDYHTYSISRGSITRAYRLRKEPLS